MSARAQALREARRGTLPRTRSMSSESLRENKIKGIDAMWLIFDLDGCGCSGGGILFLIIIVLIINGC